MADETQTVPPGAESLPAQLDSANNRNNEAAVVIRPASRNTTRSWAYAVAAVGIALLATPFNLLSASFGRAPLDPTDYASRTRRVLESTPLIDGHNDLPWLIRVELHNRLRDEKFDPKQKLLGHTDIARMKQGMMGGQFWSVYVHCDKAQDHFEDPSWVVRDTLEQIDVAKRFISEYPDTFTFCTDPKCARAAFKSGRIASMLGIEGGHQLGGSIAALRQAYELGVRYVTTTHNCDNAWATAASTVSKGGPAADKGLTAFGAHYVQEMNRLGMMLDLSHVSHQTMRDVLSLTKAPIIFSHSGAFSVSAHLRNVPDDVLRSVRHNGGIVMAVFVNRFLNMKNPSAATIHDVADHILHIASVAGWEHVGIGSDFSGTPHVPAGLEDVSKYPDLIEILMSRGVTDDQVRLLAGDNLLRVWGNIQSRAFEIQAQEPAVEEEWEGRTWHHAYKSSPYMFRSTRELADKEDWGEPHQFNVKKENE